MEDNRNADALDILDGSISVAARAIKAAIEAERAAQKTKGIKGTGKNVRDVARAISAALDPLLDDAVPRAFAYAGDRASASPEFQQRLVDLIEDAQRHLDVIAVFEHGVNGASASYMASVRKLLDGDRARVRGTMAVLRGGPVPVSVGGPSPRADAHAANQGVLPPSAKAADRRDENYAHEAARLVRAGSKLSDALRQVAPTDLMRKDESIQAAIRRTFDLMYDRKGHAILP